MQIPCLSVVWCSAQVHLCPEDEAIEALGTVAQALTSAQVPVARALFSQHNVVASGCSMHSPLYSQQSVAFASRQPGILCPSTPSLRSLMSELTNLAGRRECTRPNRCLRLSAGSPALQAGGCEGRAGLPRRGRADPTSPGCRARVCNAAAGLQPADGRCFAGHSERWALQVFCMCLSVLMRVMTHCASRLHQAHEAARGCLQGDQA